MIRTWLAKIWWRWDWSAYPELLERGERYALRPRPPARGYRGETPRDFKARLGNHLQGRANSSKP